LRRLEAQRNALNTRGEPLPRIPIDSVDRYSTTSSRGAAGSAGTGKLCRRGGQGDGEEESSGKGAAGGQIRWGLSSTSLDQAERELVVDFSPDIPISSLTPNLRVSLRADSYLLHSILPNKVDPLVSLMMVEKVPDSTYEMVGGLDKQIKEIKEVIELPVKHPELFEALGIAQPKGVLLYGPPGTGKTLLARAVAHHTDCRFIRVSGSELVQKYIGEGSRMVRELFVMAREHAPSIIFMDEIDSIGGSRGGEGGGGGDSEVQRTMMELLNQLDGFEPTKNIKVSAVLSIS